MSNSELNPQKEFSSMQMMVLIMKAKWFIIAFCILVTGITAFIAYKIPNQYSATVNVVPPKSSGSAFESLMGNLSSALKDFGLTKLSGKSESGYSLLVVLESRSIKDSMIKRFNLDKIYDIPLKKMSLIRKELDDNVNITTESEGNFTITVTDADPVRSAEMANAYVEYSNEIGQALFNYESMINRVYLENRLAGLETALKGITDSLNMFSSKNMVFSPMDQAKSISTALIDLKSEIMKQEIVEQMLVNKFGANDPYTIQQKNIITELKKQLNEAETKPGFGGNFALNKATKVGMDFMRLYASFETYTKVKAFLMPMLEEAKLNETRMTQTLFVLDKAQPPDKKSKPKRSVILLGAFLGSFALSIFFIIIFDSYRHLRRNYHNYKKNTGKA